MGSGDHMKGSLSSKGGADDVFKAADSMSQGAVPGGLAGINSLLGKANAVSTNVADQAGQAVSTHVTTDISGAEGLKPFANCMTGEALFKALTERRALTPLSIGVNTGTGIGEMKGR